MGVAFRYVQYYAELSTSNPLVTPILKSVSINCSEFVCPPIVFNPATGTALPDATTGVLYSQTVTDSPSDYTFTALGLPEGLSINPVSGLISGIVNTAETNIVITVYAVSAYCSASADYTLTASNPPNQAPVLTTIGNKTVTVGQVMIFTANANDPDNGETITYSLTDAPANAVINTSNGAFS